jgi:hypothetical protein
MLGNRVEKKDRRKLKKQEERYGRKIWKKEKDIHRKIENDKHNKPLGRKNNLLSSQSNILDSINKH